MHSTCTACSCDVDVNSNTESMRLAHLFNFTFWKSRLIVGLRHSATQDSLTRLFVMPVPKSGDLRRSNVVMMLSRSGPVR